MKDLQRCGVAYCRVSLWGVRGVKRPSKLAVPYVQLESDTRRAAQHARQLLDLISTFPTLNPTPTPNESITSTISPITNQDDSTQPHSQSLSQSQSDNTDLPQLVSSIRARYRLLCTSLGVRPRLVAAASADLDAGAMADNEPTSGIEGRRNDGAPVVLAGVVQGIEGPMKGVDTRQLRF